MTDNLHWYQWHGIKSMMLYRGFQTAAVVLGGLTPVLVLWTSIPKPLQALPAGLASIAAAVNGIYQWREDWIRFLATAQALRSEEANYKIRNPDFYPHDLDNEAALDRFISRVQHLITAETAQWENVALHSKAKRGR